SRDEQWSQQLSNAHNRNARIMLPKKSQGQYVRISQVTDLPLKGIVNLSGEEAQRHIGEHYVIAGTLQSGESDKDSFMLYADADPDRQHYVFVASDLLDSYQKAFIKDY